MVVINQAPIIKPITPSLFTGSGSVAPTPTTSNPLFSGGNTGLNKPVVPNLTTAPFPGSQTSTPNPISGGAPIIAAAPTATPTPSTGGSGFVSGLQKFFGSPLAAPTSSSSAVPPPVIPSLKTTQSGAVVNAATGGVVPSPYAGYQAPTLTPDQVNLARPGETPNIVGGAPTAPIMPTVDSTTTTAPTAPVTPDPLSSPLYTSPAYEAALKAYQVDSALSPAELQAQQDLNNLQTSARTAITNTKNQPIPLEFQTGQQKNLTEQTANLQQPLEAQLALAQAQRQAKMQSDQAILSAEGSKIAGFRDLNKPISVPIGSTVINPSNGSTVFGGGQQDIIGKAIADGRLTPDMVTRYGQAGILSALQLDPNYNFITQKSSVAADSKSLTDAQSYADTTSRALSTANSNLTKLQTFMGQYGVNQSDIPLVNQLTNKIKSGTADAGVIASFNAQLNDLRAEYSQVLSKGGARSVETDNAAKSLIPDNISPAQLAQVAQAIQSNGNSAVQEANQKVSDIKTRIGSNSGSSSTGASDAGTVVQTKAGAINTNW